MSTLSRDLAHAVTRYDRMREKRKGYNVYALGQYLIACDRIVERVAQGETLQAAIEEEFINRLRDSVLRYMAKAGHPVAVR